MSRVLVDISSLAPASSPRCRPACWSSENGDQHGAGAVLLIAASGCALLCPAATSGYALFLFAFFVLACGMNLLQVAANHNAG
jgi:hypothetical protein